jgi:multiple sugar transport system substrate-binding protein
MTGFSKAAALLATCAAAFAGCVPTQGDNEIVVQRFFGVCTAQYGHQTDVAAASTECGIMTTLINRFAQENADIRVQVNPVPWPGYDQLAAQLVTNDAPDLVTMHLSAISDYQSRNLLEPMEEGLRAAGVDPAAFTAASLKGVTKQGRIYGMPIDTWAPLWHINVNYFRRAGMMHNGEPILPSSPEELLAQARRFTRSTGKPYFVQVLSKERVTFARNLYTYLMQQDASFFANPQRIRLQTPEARRVTLLFKAIYDENLTTKNQDYAAALNGFVNGAGGVLLGGTWLIGDFHAESLRPGRPLSNGYTVMMYPQLYPGRDAVFADGHAWVMPVKRRTPTQRKAVFRLLRFMAQNNGEWARTGHLPAFRDAIGSEAFNNLPYRHNIAKLANVGTPLPASVQRQFAVQDIVGEEMASAVKGQKSVDRALADAEHRVNELLAHLP